MLHINQCKLHAPVVLLTPPTDRNPTGASLKVYMTLDHGLVTRCLCTDDPARGST